jgi:hypothetical protein
MVKVIPPGSFDFGMPVAKLVDIHSRGIDKSWIEKRASVFDKQICSIQPEKDHSYIHLISMGAMENYGGNKNGDSFNEKSANYELPEPKDGISKIIKLKGGLVEYHPTFEKHAKVYRDHKNDSPEKAVGDVKFAAYNSDMHRGELLIRVPHNKTWESDLHKLASGEEIPFSMSVRVPFDTCNYCGNQSKTRKEYCEHLKNNLTDITKSGHQICAINDHGTFFDISRVFKPADRIAYSLSKVASSTEIIGGAELAEMLGISAPTTILGEGNSEKSVLKIAAARKLAAIEKLVEGNALAKDNKHLASCCPSEPISEESMNTLKDSDLNGVLKSLADAKISLSVKDFLRLVTGSNDESVSGNISEVESILPGIHNRLLDSGEVDECASDSSYDPESVSVSRRVKEAVESLKRDHSLDFGPTIKRSGLAIIRNTVPGLNHSLAIKRASVSKSANILAKEYAKYQISFASQFIDSPEINRLTVLRNYLKV